MSVTITVAPKSVPTGVVEEFNPSVTGQTRTVSPQKTSFSVSLWNDGPDPVYVGINQSPSKVTPINSGESFHADYNSPKIETVSLICDEGKNATVRMFCKA